MIDDHLHRGKVLRHGLRITAADELILASARTRLLLRGLLLLEIVLQNFLFVRFFESDEI